MKRRQHWLTRADSVRRLWIVFIVILILTVVPEFFLNRHGSFGIDGRFAFYAWYGFVSCLIMILGSKVLGVFLKRKDTYYKD